MNIRYEFLTGEIFEIEVPESIGEVAIAIDRDIYNGDRRETRRHNSINNMEEKGVQLSDDSTDIPTLFEQQEMCEALHHALDKLLPQQKELVHMVFFEGKTISDIARAEGVYEGAIRNRLRKIYKRLKIFLD